MTNKITENQIEALTIELLETRGYHYIYGPDIAPDSKQEIYFSENDPTPPSGGRGAPGVRPLATAKDFSVVQGGSFK